MNETESDQQRLSQQLEADLYGVRKRIGSTSMASSRDSVFDTVNSVEKPESEMLAAPLGDASDESMNGA